MVTPKVFVTISIIPQALTIINIPIIPQIIWFRPVLLASSLSEPLIKSTTPQKNITKDKVNKSKIKGAIIWLLKLDIRVSVVIYYYDYTDTIAFNYNKIIEVRDSITKLYIPGSIDNSYMTTSKTIMPQFAPINFNGNYAVETRGLWETEVDFMGGPFISITSVDEKRMRVVTVEGYVYYPNNKKRDKLKQMESILHTLKFMD